MIRTDRMTYNEGNTVDIPQVDLLTFLFGNATRLYNERVTQKLTRTQNQNIAQQWKIRPFMQRRTIRPE